MRGTLSLKTAALGLLIAGAALLSPGEARAQVVYYGTHATYYAPAPVVAAPVYVAAPAAYVVPYAPAPVVTYRPVVTYSAPAVVEYPAPVYVPPYRETYSRGLLHRRYRTDTALPGGPIVTHVERRNLFGTHVRERYHY